MTERRIELGVRSRFSGVDATVTRKGLEIGGFYDSFVGLPGRFIPWSELDAARRKVMSKEPLDEAEREERDAPEWGRRRGRGMSSGLSSDGGWELPGMWEPADLWSLDYEVDENGVESARWPAEPPR